MPVLNARQWCEWKIYNEIEPFGYPEQDAQNAWTRHVIATSAGAKKSSGEKLKEEDFSFAQMREKAWKKANKPKQSVESMKRVLMDMANTQNRRHRKLHQDPPKSKRKSDKGENN